MNLLSSCTSGGCGAKIGPGELAAALAGLPVAHAPNLLVGFHSSDDACVYRLDERRSLVCTVDFFPAMVEEPRAFGRIAAANALSDVFAMGGEPLLALNMVCFPERGDMADLGEILAGGAEVALEAGCAIAGGHSIYDRELKYGLSVTGVVDTARVLRNDTPRAGDALILTKPLGTGIVLSARRAGMADERAYRRAIDVMQRLNRDAAAAARPFDVSACTDVTGFGLLGHAREMASDSSTIRIDPDALPLQELALDYAREYLTTAAGQRNRNHLEHDVELGALPPAMQEILFDPQTSGGLLIAVAADQADALLRAIRRNDPDAALIGAVLPRGKRPLEVERIHTI